MPDYKEQYPVGAIVQVASRDELNEFLRTWRYHHKLRPEQLEFAGRTSRVEDLSFYHGGDVLYRLADIPGIWHERCLRRAT
jgi:hypothetical protein